MRQATAAKEQGNEQFKAGKWAWACDLYTEAPPSPPPLPSPRGFSSR